jgi:hypothetical protein
MIRLIAGSAATSASTFSIRSGMWPCAADHHGGAVGTAK